MILNIEGEVEVDELVSSALRTTEQGVPAVLPSDAMTEPFSSFFSASIDANLVLAVNSPSAKVDASRSFLFLAPSFWLSFFLRGRGVRRIDEK